ncbi:phosphate ABC transporter substrate-binding protein PstS [Parvibaculum sedimenti]|uniref:Phosphate-binding protein PstS n=1 Tax=Parvibaculum sedimenti TaxID=2608632 RepID=A0A6N6VGZ1_9HYPH|nr:phosphate ABC transporter substrate-binding protein PstS [Parvibaculum sedimenti]KAB7739513.1 phosphate ABC transporter substrate-binding protein PstS [Parvibaculum sedimenti]
MLKSLAKLGRASLFAVSALVVATAANAGDISGAGATFPYPIYAKWADAYKKETGIGLNYQSIGSGGGIKQIKAKTVDFGASDAPLKGEDLSSIGLAQFPMVMGAIVPVVNLPGVKPGEMKLTGHVLAEIYLGNITKWNDPQIVKINKGVNLPDSSIAVVHRSDGSGTTFNFAYYLNAVDAKWSSVGVNTSLEWPVGLGGKGNEGVSALVGQTQGSIGYVEYAYALQNHLTYTDMINKAGKTVSPSLKTIQAAAANANWSSVPGFGVILADQPGADSWPMTAATFILVYKAQDKPENAKAVLNFFSWCYDKGDKMAEDLIYVPMPDNVVEMVKKSWSEVKDASGKPVL